jgi:hypothetical protein
MESQRSNAPPTLDEGSVHIDTTIPSTLFTSIACEHGDIEEVQEWADTIVGDTHLGKRKTNLIHLNGNEKGSNSLMNLRRMKSLGVTIAQPTLVEVMVERRMVMVAIGMVEVMLECMVLGVVVLDGVMLGEWYVGLEIH